MKQISLYFTVVFFTTVGSYLVVDSLLIVAKTTITTVWEKHCKAQKLMEQIFDLGPRFGLMALNVPEMAQSRK